MLSSYRDMSMVTKSRRSQRAESGTEEIQKPEVVEDYNVNMSSMDKG